MTKVPTIFEKSDRPGFFANLDRGGKIQRVKLGNTKAEATIALAAELAKLDPAVPPVPSPVNGVLTLAGLLDRWLAYIKLSKSDATYRSYSRYAAIWKEAQGELPAASITPDHISKLLREKFAIKADGKTPMSESCRWQMEKVAIGSFKWAAKPRQALVIKNPLDGYERETVCGEREAWIDETQYATPCLPPIFDSGRYAVLSSDRFCREIRPCPFSRAAHVQSALLRRAVYSCESPNHVSTFSTAARAIAHLEGKEAGQWDVRLVSRTSREEVAEYLKRSGVHNVCHDANPDGTGGHTISVDDLLASWTL